MKRTVILIFSAILVISLIFSCSSNKISPTSPIQQVSAMKNGCQQTPTLTPIGPEPIGPEHPYPYVPTATATAIHVCPGSNTNNACSSNQGNKCGWEKHDKFTKMCHIPCSGEHAEELKCLDVNIVMENPYFYTSDNYPGYYIGDPINFEVQITNNGKKDFKNLEVITVQEYHDSGICDRWWDPNPEFVTITAGEALPGDPTTIWKDVTLKPGQELVLDGTYTPPISTCSGLDQVSIAIKHVSECSHRMTTIYYNPDATIYCPPPPAK